MLDKPQIVQTAAQQTAVIRLTIAREEIRNVMGPGIGELMAAIAAQGIAPAGPIFSHHLRMDPDIFDFEIGVPVTAAVSATGRVKPGQLPAATVARTVYQGPYEDLGPAWAEFITWITAEGHTPGPDLWESYVAGPESNPDPTSWRTELSRPLTRWRGSLEIPRVENRFAGFPPYKGASDAVGWTTLCLSTNSCERLPRSIAVIPLR